MFRSGSTVQFQLASHLVEHFGRGERLGWRNAEDFAAMRAEYPADGWLRVFKAHHLTAAIRAELAASGGLVITTDRDIRDVVASAIRKNGWSFRHIWKHRMLARWTGRFDEWAALPGALVSRYDLLVADLGAEAVRIGRLLGVDVSADLAATIAAAYSVERQRQRTAEVRVRRAQQQLETRYVAWLDRRLAEAVVASLPTIDDAAVSGLSFARVRHIAAARGGPNAWRYGDLAFDRRHDYRQIWLHQFLRAKVLRVLFGGFPEQIASAKEMDDLHRAAVLPADHRLYVLDRNAVVFGESTSRGRLTANCAASLRRAGFEVDRRRLFIGRRPSLLRRAVRAVSGLRAA